MIGHALMRRGIVALLLACPLFIAFTLTWPSSAGLDQLPATAQTPLSADGKPCLGPQADRSAEFPSAYCFAPGTPEEIVRQYNQETRQLQPLFYTFARWSGTTGSPRALTWSFIPDGVTISTGKNNELFARMDSLFASAGGRATWIGIFQASFDRWAQITGLSYTRITYNGNDWDDGASFGTSGGTNRGDIRIGMIDIDGSGTVLARNFYPQHGDMTLDRSENWASSANNYRFLRNTILHEHGHGIGLEHVCPSNRTKLMEPTLATTFDGPQHDDLRGAQQLYGDDFENNNTFGTATILGALDVASPIQLGPISPAITNAAMLSIDADGEVDFFRFTIPPMRGLTCTVTPLGSTYDSSMQNEDGTCGSGNNVNSLTLADLNVQVLGSDGLTVLANGAARPAGEAETISGLVLTLPGTYYVRVYEGNIPAGPQFYTLSLSVIDLDCNGNGVLDTVDLAVGTSTDCNANAVPDECELNGATDTDADALLDACEWAHGDFDLDGDTDQVDFASIQRCMLGPLPQNDPACIPTRLNSGSQVDSTDVDIFLECLSGAGVPYDPACNGG